MVASWFYFIFLKHRFHILHFPNSTGLFTKPTGRHYTKYQIFPDIVLKSPIDDIRNVINLEPTGML